MIRFFLRCRLAPLLCSLGAALVFAPSTAHAQLTFAVAPTHSDAVVEHLPYTAEKLMQTHRMLADGTRSEQDFTLTEARNSAGQVASVVCLRASGRVALTCNLAAHNVFDPSAHTLLMWNSAAKQGTLIHLPQPGAKFTGLADKSAPASKPVHPEQLGHRLIHGVLATGERTITVTPAGTMGNDEAIVSSSEVWHDDALHMVVLLTSTSPKAGETQIELVSLTRGEPDAALFHLPDGYSVHDVQPRAPMVASKNNMTPAVDMAHLPTLTYDAAMAQLDDSDPLTRATAAAVLVKMAVAGSDLQQKDKVAYALARAKLNLKDAESLAQQAVTAAERQTATATPSPVLERQLARYWDTLGYTYGREGDVERERHYLVSAFTLDPMAYYGNHLARSYEDAGQTSEAIELYAQALAGSGSEQMKALISSRLAALGGGRTRDPGTAFPSGPAADGAAIFEVRMGGGQPPAGRFVVGDATLEAAATQIAEGVSALWPLPDAGPEVIVRRVNVRCAATEKPACRILPLGSRQAQP